MSGVVVVVLEIASDLDPHEGKEETASSGAGCCKAALDG